MVNMRIPMQVIKKCQRMTLLQMDSTLIDLKISTVAAIRSGDTEKVVAFNNKKALILKIRRQKKAGKCACGNAKASRAERCWMCARVVGLGMHAKRKRRIEA